MRLLGTKGNQAAQKLSNFVVAHLRPALIHTIAQRRPMLGAAFRALIALREADSKTIEFKVAERLEPRRLPPSNDERMPRRFC